MSSTSKQLPRKRQKYVKINITRPIYTEKDFRKKYDPIEVEVTWMEKLKDSFRKIQITRKSVWEFVKRLFPIISWLPKYDVWDDGIHDVLAGVTVAIMRIPQELAYAILATLPAVYGLYTAFFPVLVYPILGTSRHISIGSQAIVSVMTGQAINAILGRDGNDVGTLDPAEGTTNEEDDTQQRIDLAVALCLIVGIIQICMGILRLGFVTIYLSEPLVNGFIAGASFQVLFGSQFPKMFGVKVDQHPGSFEIIYIYKDFFLRLYQTNACSLSISLVTLMTLVLINELNDWQAYKGWCRRDGVGGKRLPIPSELFVVIIATLVSSVGDFESKYNLSVVGRIATGLPSPVLPQVKYIGDVFRTAVSISIVGFAISISVAQMFANKHNYDLHANQELIAYGSCHVFGSFFQCIPQTTSMSRTAVQEGSGGRTQIVGIVASLVVLVTLLWLAPLMATLPECVLAVIIAVSLRGMFRNCRQLPTLWRVSFLDFLVWIVTFTLVVLLGVDEGLLFSLVFAFLTLVVRTQSPYCTLMGRVKDTDIYKDISDIEEAEEISGIKIFRCSSSPCFVNAEYFKSELYKKVGVNPQQILIDREQANKMRKKRKMFKKEEESLLSESYATYNSTNQLSQIRLQAVIIECSMFNYVDVVGIKTLQNIASAYKKIGIHVGFTNCKGPVRKALLFSSHLDDSRKIGLDRMYLSVHDAVLNCLYKNPRTPYGSRAGSRANSLSESNSQIPSRIPSLVPESPLDIPPSLAGLNMMSNQRTLLTDVLHELEERAEEFHQDEEIGLSISVSCDPVAREWAGFDMTRNTDDLNAANVKQIKEQV